MGVSGTAYSFLYGFLEFDIVIFPQICYYIINILNIKGRKQNDGYSFFF